VAKDKKKKIDKKAGAAKSTSSLKALAQNPLVADVVAAALVATASALKDSRRARALASDVGDELAKLSRAGTRQGEALWDMALQIGRRSLQAAMSGDDTIESARPKAKPKPASKAKPKPAWKAKPKPASKAKPKSTAKKSSKKKLAGSGKR
jgi:hypothetical protein